MSILTETPFSPLQNNAEVFAKDLYFNSKHIRKHPACISQPCSFRPPEASDYLEKTYEQEQITVKSLLDKKKIEK